MHPSDYTTISFPVLGLELNPGRSFDIGPLTVNFYGLIIGIGLLLAVLYGCKRSKQFGIKQDDILVLAGSIPVSMPVTIYSDIMKQLRDRMGQNGPLVVVDATKEVLLNALVHHPFLIKPNHHELGELFDVTITTREEVIPFAKKLQQQGARNVLVSMGGLGAVLVDEQGEVHLKGAPEGTVVNSVGAGDSMVAGFLAGWLEKQDYEYAFYMGLAAGSASAFSENLATREEVDSVFRNLYLK